MNNNQAVNIQLPMFEGPLGLLLYLIRKEEMDIMDIQIHKITGQYLEYIKLMKELDLEVAGDFVAMASTLIQIKSRMLLPQYDENGEVVETEDPRKELVQRLLEYQKYQEAARSLYERPLLGRDTWARGIREKIENKEEEIVLDENPVFALISAYRRAVKTAKKKIHQVTAKLQSISSRIAEIKNLLTVGHKTPMSELLTATENRRKQLLITFLSVLELGKIGFVYLFQTENYQEIYVEARKVIEGEAISKVEEYESVHAEMPEATPAPVKVSLQDQDLDAEFDEAIAPSQMAFEGALDEGFADTDSYGAPIEMATDDEIAQAEKELSLAGTSEESGEANV